MTEKDTASAPKGYEAAQKIVRTYSDSLVRFAYGYVRDAAAAEDVAAEAIALLILKNKHFENQPKMRAYLYKTARSKAIDYLRRHKNQVPLEDAEYGLTSESAEMSVLRKVRNETLHQCMDRLQESYREVLILTYFEGFSLETAGRIMGKSVRQMYNLHARAKVALQNLLIKEGISCEDL